MVVRKLGFKKKPRPLLPKNEAEQKFQLLMEEEGNGTGEGNPYLKIRDLVLADKNLWRSRFVFLGLLKIQKQLNDALLEIKRSESGKNHKQFKTKKIKQLAQSQIESDSDCIASAVLTVLPNHKTIAKKYRVGPEAKSDHSKDVYLRWLMDSWNCYEPETRLRAMEQIPWGQWQDRRTIFGVGNREAHNVRHLFDLLFPGRATTEVKNLQQRAYNYFARAVEYNIGHRQWNWMGDRENVLEILTMVIKNSKDHFLQPQAATLAYRYIRDKMGIGNEYFADEKGSRLQIQTIALQNLAEAVEPIAPDQAAFFQEQAAIWLREYDLQQLAWEFSEQATELTKAKDYDRLLELMEDSKKTLQQRREELELRKLSAPLPPESLQLQA